MPDSDCLSLKDALLELERVAPEVPLLALGQTIFWDEPMKAGVAQTLQQLESKRRLVAAVHDTDYFAKLPNAAHQAGKFRAVAHNDTTTRGFWSAAGEFSTLFGSETVVTRDALAHAGLRIERVLRARPNYLDEATEAWGWRGIASLEERPPITADLPVRQLLPELKATLDWALDRTIGCLNGEGRHSAEELADQLRAKLCDAAENGTQSLSDLYQKLLPEVYSFAANAPIDIDVSATTKLLQFNRETCERPRFALLDLFVNHDTREMARAAYDEAIQGAPGLYTLARFGTGAIPFDVVIPGKGRGTLRLGTRGAVINTPKPEFLSYKKPLTSACELAELLEAKFGPNCAIVGKAVSLIGSLGREFVFVFHEGASSYVKYSRKMHQILASKGYPQPVHPILRVRYDAWTALHVCCSWLRLPDEFSHAFGTEETCSPSFASRWKEVGREQEALLQKLGKLRRPVDLIQFLNEFLGGCWNRVADEYQGLHGRLQQLQDDMEAIRQKRHVLLKEWRDLKRERVEVEVKRGEHFREKIFEKEPSAEDLAQRDAFGKRLEEIQHRSTELQNQMRHSLHDQAALAKDPEVERVHERRRSIELEAELKRARLIRNAIIASRGLAAANLRPSAWWFRLVCPDGLWFRETIDTAQSYLEPLV